MWRKLQQHEDNEAEKEDLLLKKNLMYHRAQLRNGVAKFQLVVPSELRKKVLRMDHEAIFSGHQGVKRTYERIWNVFLWPGLHADVNRFFSFVWRMSEVCY